MSVYYCPGCGNATICGKIEIFGDSFEKQEKITKIIKKRILEGRVPLEEQKLCFICEEAEKRRDFKKLENGQESIIYCINCFDLRIDGIWQKFTFFQKENLRSVFLKGLLFLEGDAIDECPHCVEISIFVRERMINFCNDSYKPFERRQNETKPV